MLGHVVWLTAPIFQLSMQGSGVALGATGEAWSGTAQQQDSWAL